MNQVITERTTAMKQGPIITAVVMTVFAAAGAGTLVLIKDSPSDSTQGLTQVTETTIPTPDSVTRPEARQSCTATLQRGAVEGDYPDHATITCGDFSRTVSGDFGDRVTNHYPEGQGVKTLIVVGDEVRAWLRDTDGSCLVLYTLDGPPVACKTSPSSTQEPTEGNTVAPEGEIAPSV